MILTAMIFALPLVAVGLIATLAQTLRAEQSQSIPRGVLLGGRLSVLLLCVFTVTVMPFAGWGDWEHLFWGFHLGLLGMFCNAGLFLVPLPAKGSGPSADSPNGPTAVLPLIMFATVGSLPLVLIQLNPEAFSHFRLTSSPLAGVLDLAAWGLGGSLPDYLEPATSVARERGVDFLPRAITVSFGMTLIAAWLCIVHSTIYLISRAIPKGLQSRVLVWWAAPIFLLGCVAARTLDLSFPWLRPGFFFAGPAYDSGIWTSDPEVMKSYGPVLVSALALGAIHCVVAWRAGRRAQS